jgi:protease II
MRKILDIFLFSVLTIMLTSGKTVRNNVIYTKPYELAKDTAWLKSQISVDSFRLQIIKPSTGVQFYKNGIIFLSLDKTERKMVSKQISFGAAEAYYASVNDSTTGSHNLFSSSAPFSYPAEGMSFSNDFKTVYFTRISAQDNKEKIYMSKISTDQKQNEGIDQRSSPVLYRKCKFYSSCTFSK